MCSKISVVSKSLVAIMFLLVLLAYGSKLSLGTCIMALTPVLCYYVTSFDYGSKKKRSKGLSCRCRLSNIMSESNFYSSIRCGNKFLFHYFFCKGNKHCLPQHQRDEFSCFIIITPRDLGKP